MIVMDMIACITILY